MQMWHLQSDTVTTITCEACKETRVAMSANGARIAFETPYHQSVVVWDTHTLQQLRTLPITSISSFNFSADGPHLACASWDRLVRIWNVASGLAYPCQFPHIHPVRHVQLNENGSRFVSYDILGYGRLWDVKISSCLMTCSNPCWSSNLHQHCVAAIKGHLGIFKGCPIMGWQNSDDGHDQQLGFTHSILLPLGHVFFSVYHRSTFWPSCAIQH